MNDRHGHGGSRLFTLRVWCEETEPGQTEWRGKLHDVASGDSTYFRNWDGLTTSLTALLTRPALPEQRSKRTRKVNKPDAADGLITDDD